MTEKEKAEAYDKAIERAKKLYDNGITEEIFPELKEDDTERIRKDLIQWFDEFHDIIWRGHYKKDIIDWLEKQGEQKRQVHFPKFTFDDILALQCCMVTVKNVQEDNELYEQLNLIHNKMYDAYKLGKQGETSPILSNFLNTEKNEQKSADKVEPKFKVGDWIISSVLGTARIIGVNDSNEFQLEYIDGKQEFSSIDYVNYAYDKWTINNAKDGDVLALSWLEDKNLWEKIIIFKKYHSERVKGIYSTPCVEGYGNTFKNGKMAFTDEEVPYYSKTWTWNLHPATKEQRDLLFQKIKEAGYEWDAEKKELKKLDLVPNKKPILGGLNMKTYNDVNIGDTVYIWGSGDSSVDETTITEKHDDRGHWNLKFSNGCVGRALKNGTSSTMGMYACLVYSDKEAVRESINEQIKILSNINI